MDSCTPEAGDSCTEKDNSIPPSTQEKIKKTHSTMQSHGAMVILLRNIALKLSDLIETKFSDTQEHVRIKSSEIMVNFSESLRHAEHNAESFSAKPENLETAVNEAIKEYDNYLQDQLKTTRKEIYSSLRQSINIIRTSTDNILEAIDEDYVGKKILDAIRSKCEEVLKEDIIKEIKDTKLQNKDLKLINERAERFVRPIVEEIKKTVARTRTDMYNMRNRIQNKMEATYNGIVSFMDSTINHLTTIGARMLKDLQITQEVNLLVCSQQRSLNNVTCPVLQVAVTNVKFKAREYERITSNLAELTARQVRCELVSYINYVEIMTESVQPKLILTDVLAVMFMSCKEEGGNITKGQMIKIFDRAQAIAPLAEWPIAKKKAIITEKTIMVSKKKEISSSRGKCKVEYVYTLKEAPEKECPMKEHHTDPSGTGCPIRCNTTERDSPKKGIEEID